MDDFFGTLLKIIGFLIVFGSILFLVIVVTKLIGYRAKQAMNGKYINVLESVSLGIDKNIFLVKVSNEYILLSSSGKKIDFLTSVKIDELIETDQAKSNENFSFKSIFDKYVKKELKKDSDTYKSTNKNIFNYNIARMKKIVNKVSTKDKKNGDESDENKKS
ncbi:MAG: flagellar biosynthetic protein FliO [Clostridiales bacterium]